MNRCRIHRSAPAISTAILDGLRSMPSALVSDQLDRIGVVAGVARVAVGDTPTGEIIVGTARTVRTRPGDNLVIYKAIQCAPTGSILVIDAGGSLDRAVMGEIVVHHAASSGMSGLIIDGAIRDRSEIARGPIPVFARGVTPAGPYKSGPGAIHGQVALGGVPVADGDAVVADDDGVVIVPRQDLDRVLEGGRRQLGREEEMLAAAIAGQLDTAWVDSALEVTDHG